jgi:hypothetical protein
MAMLSRFGADTTAEPVAVHNRIGPLPGGKRGRAVPAFATTNWSDISAGDGGAEKRPCGP